MRLELFEKVKFRAYHIHERVEIHRISDIFKKYEKFSLSEKFKN